MSLIVVCRSTGYDSWFVGFDFEVWYLWIGLVVLCGMRLDCVFVCLGWFLDFGVWGCGCGFLCWCTVLLDLGLGFSWVLRVMICGVLCFEFPSLWFSLVVGFGVCVFHGLVFCVLLAIRFCGLSGICWKLAI